MNIKTELHNLKTMVLNESHISDNAKEKIANRINQIEKGVVINYIPCCTELCSCGSLNAKEKTDMSKPYECADCDKPIYKN